MSIFERRNATLERLARTGFFASTIAFAAFLLADLLRPGFVSRAFSVHAFVFAAIIFAAIWARTEPMPSPRPRLAGTLTLAIALLFGIVAWNASGDIGLAALAAAAAPIASRASED